MSAVLGVSVGASAVRMATQAGPDPVTAGFHRHAVEVNTGAGEDVAARSIGVLLEGADHADIDATGVAYRGDAQAGAMHDAMARQHLYNYRLVPEAAAVVALLESVGQLGPDDHTLVLYDLGSSGVTVSVVDRYSRDVVAFDHGDVAGGDRFDALIADQQLRERGLEPPTDQWAAADLLARCRVAKEQLSTTGAACLPGDGGLILLNRERFEALVRVPVEASARLTREVVAASGRHPDVLVLLGGGARIPLVQSLLQGWLALPTIVPPEPEMVVAQGAALLATPVEPPQPAPEESDGPTVGAHRRRHGPSKRQLAVAGVAAAGLVAIAGLGFALDHDPESTPQGERQATEVLLPPTTTLPPPTTTTTPPPPPPAPTPAPQPVEVVESPAPPPPPAPRYLNLPAPIQIQVPPNIQLPPGMVR